MRTEGREAGRGFYREGRERWGRMKWRPGIGQRKSIDQVMYKWNAAWHRWKIKVGVIGD